MRKTRALALVGVMLRAAAPVGNAAAAENDDAFRYVADASSTENLQFELIPGGGGRRRTILRKRAKKPVGGNLYHVEYYVHGVDARAGRIAFARSVMINKEWVEPDPYTGKPQEYSHGHEGYIKLVVMDMRGESRREFCLDPGYEVYTPRISPDGRRVAFAYGTTNDVSECIRSRIRLLDLPTGGIRDITPDLADTWAWAPAWSPDGTRLAFHVREKRSAHGYLVAAAVDGGEPWRLAALARPGRRISWAQKGDSILFEFGRQEYRRGNGYAEKVRISTLDLKTRSIRHLVDAIVTDYTEALVGHLPSGEVLYRAVDPAIAQRRYYTTSWNVCLPLPASEAYVLGPARPGRPRRLAVRVDGDANIYPILPPGSRVEAASLAAYPPFEFGGAEAAEPPGKDAIEITTLARLDGEGESVRVEALVAPEAAIQSAWWEDSEGNFYNGMAAEIPRPMFERGVFFFAIKDDGATYRRQVRASVGAPPQAAYVNPMGSRKLDVEVGYGENKLRIRLLDEVTLDLVYIPRGAITTSGVYEKERFGRENWVHFIDDPDFPEHMDRPRTRTVGPFYMGAYEVTQEQFEAVTGNNPSTFKALKLPVETVEAGAAKEFCRRLSEAAGLKVRLPTATEWDYACRAGTTTRYYWGDELSPERCNYAAAWAGAAVETEADWKQRRDRISTGHTRPVGSYAPNPWGLYDMFGNVAEMCCGRRMLGKIKQDGTVTYEVRRYPGPDDASDEETCFPNMGGGWVHYGEILTNGRDLAHITFGTDWTGFRVLVEAEGRHEPESDEPKF